MTNFIYLPTKEIFTAKGLEMRGVNPNDIELVRRAGYALVEYVYPQYDNRTHYLVPKAELTPKGQDFVQEFDVLPLSEEELARALEQAKHDKLTSVNGNCETLMEQLVDTYPQMEVSTFYKQEEEARDIIAGATPKTNMLAALAAERGIEIHELATRVIAKADAFAVATGYFMGQRQKMEDEIDAAQNVAELDAIDTNFKPLPSVE